MFTLRFLFIFLQMSESLQSTIELQGLNARTMAVLLDFIYTETVEVTVENVQELLPSACLLQLSGMYKDLSEKVVPCFDLYSLYFYCDFERSLNRKCWIICCPWSWFSSITRVIPAWFVSKNVIKKESPQKVNRVISQEELMGRVES